LDTWYTDFGRTLPWRGIDDPYRIWLSEIILQQTRIEQGRDYYHRFVEAFPTVSDLAAASEEQVLRLWQGLGYYSRARNLHAAAQYIMNECNGVFPSDYEGVLKLKGVGRYTAAAIASFAFRLPYPVIDGNVYRFISRLYGIHTPIGTTAAYREFETLLAKLIDKERPDLFNQAIMDFGSIYCKPIEPDCTSCIFYRECVARNEGQVALLPAKPLHKQATTRYFYYLDTRWDLSRQTMLMYQRGPGDIWQGLYEPPLLETTEPIASQHILATAEDKLIEWFGEKPLSIQCGPEYTHQLTHRTIKAQFLLVKFNRQPCKIPEYLLPIAITDIKTLPISRLIDRYLSEM
jgi:A/G-specific adenine glycosylase